MISGTGLPRFKSCAQSHYSDVGKIWEISYIFTFFVETWCAVDEFFIDA